jgi:hypothetical protein
MCIHIGSTFGTPPCSEIVSSGPIISPKRDKQVYSRRVTSDAMRECTSVKLVGQAILEDINLFTLGNAFLIECHVIVKFSAVVWGRLDGWSWPISVA